jgi:hypothetical protein
MWRCFLRCLAGLLVLGACALPAARADIMTPSKYYDDLSEEERERTPALQIFLAFLFTASVMVIVCTPSRKRH